MTCEILNALDRDLDLIGEAIRRLIDGTCCLMDEDKVSAFELYNQVHTAIRDHIQIEDQIHETLLKEGTAPDQLSERVKQMNSEHHRLEMLLKWVRRELDDENGESFRMALQLLADTFANHHRDLETPACNLTLQKAIRPELQQSLLQRTQERFLC